VIAHETYLGVRKMGFEDNSISLDDLLSIAIAMRTQRKTVADASLEFEKSGWKHLKKINGTILQYYCIRQAFFFLTNKTTL
jgi:hypothetical protein